MTYTEPTAEQNSANHSTIANHATRVRRSRKGQKNSDAHGAPALPALSSTIDEIREQWRRRQAWHRAEKSLTLQAKAMCRRLVGGIGKEALKEADLLFAAATGKKVNKKPVEHPKANDAAMAMMPLLEGRDAIHPKLMAVEKRLEELAMLTPGAAFVRDTECFGELSLAAVIGECGDLSDYANPGKMWKRFGAAVMPDGTRQRRVKGAEAMEHGYSPSRRAVLYTIGVSMLMGGGTYAPVYRERKEYEVARFKADPNAALYEDPSGAKKKRKAKKVVEDVVLGDDESDDDPTKPKAYGTLKHAHNRAMRYMQKRIIRDLHRSWRREATLSMPEGATLGLSPANFFQDAAE